MVGLAAESIDPKTIMIGATSLKARRTACSMRAKKGGRDRQFGRTNGGMNTKLHTITDTDGRPIRFFLSAGQVSDCTGAAAMMGSLPKADWILADRCCDADWLREMSRDRGIKACIPGRKSCEKTVKYHKCRSKRRNRIEIMFGRLKDRRRVATRCDRCPETYLCAIALAATVLFCLRSGTRPDPGGRGYTRIAQALRVAVGAARAADTPPMAFTFATVAGAAQSKAITSAQIKVEGITGSAPISITCGGCSINRAAFTTEAGGIRPYDKLRVRMTSASAEDTGVSATVTSGGVAGTLTATPAAPALVPTNFVTSVTFDTDLAGWTFYSFNNDYVSNPISAVRGTRTAESRMRITAATNATYPQGMTTLSMLTIAQVYTVSIK